jgi:hypothetical protein
MTFLGQRTVAPGRGVYDTRALKPVVEARETIVVLTQGCCWEMRPRRPRKDETGRVAKACQRRQTCSYAVVVDEHEMAGHHSLENQRAKQKGL